MRSGRSIAAKLFLVGLCLALATFHAQGAGSPSQSDHTPQWLRAGLQKRWTGDLDGMIQRGWIRALVVFNKTYYFVDKGTQRGTAYDGLTLFEDELNKLLKIRKRRIHVTFIPVKRNELIPALLDGRGDIAAAGLTITPGRDKLVDFSDPLLAPVDEIIVTGPTTPAIATLDELSGQEIFVRQSSAYHEHLLELNAKFEKAGKAPIRLKLASENLEDEDLLEMLNAGLVRFVVVNRPIVDLWTKVLPNIKARPDLVINSGGEIAWMFRENSPQLRRAVNEFIKRHPTGDPTRAEIYRKYLKSTKFIKNATSDEELRKFEATVDLFRKYGSKYSIDYLMMMAEGYQESRLDQRAKSRVGAVGVMQVMPATGRSLKIGDVRQLEPNIHAGVKYIAFMRNEYFGDEPIDELNRDLFSFAAYNAGPNRIMRLRRVAAQRGLDPNVWFSNVEVVVAEKVGMETVNYVGNIFKYYIAYKLVSESEAERLKTKGSN